MGVSRYTWYLYLVVMAILWFSCEHAPPLPEPVVPERVHVKDTTTSSNDVTAQDDTLKPRHIGIPVLQDVQVKAYFQFIDSVVAAYDSLVCYPLTEHLLIHQNPWVIDTLMSFDYYRQKEAGHFIYDQRELVVLHQGDTLWLPDENKAAQITLKLSRTTIDVNIPEYKLRIIVGDSTWYTFPVRVGRNEVKYLKTAGREVSLRTPTGTGSIVRIERDPWFIDPVTGDRYFMTKRDDGKYTTMPLIPWLEPQLDGVRYGSLIHPTTNAKTLGKAYSHGCVGMGEAEAWMVYYYAPLYTKVVFRYQLQVIDEKGDTLQLKDIYHDKEHRKVADLCRDFPSC